MSYSSRGAAATAEMNPFSRPMPGQYGNMQSSWRQPSVGYDYGNMQSGWRAPSTGFDAGAFLSDNKIAVAIAAALLAGGIAYAYGYR